jgi:hypothetical protein
MPAAAAAASSAAAATASAHRSRVLSLYRSLFRASRGMPTANRVAFVRASARQRFREHAALDPASPAAAEAVVFADTMLDQVEAQAKHLTRVFSDPRAHGM